MFVRTNRVGLFFSKETSPSHLIDCPHWLKKVKRKKKECGFTKLEGPLVLLFFIRSITHHQSRFVPTVRYIRLIRVTLFQFQCCRVSPTGKVTAYRTDFSQQQQQPDVVWSKEQQKERNDIWHFVNVFWFDCPLAGVKLTSDGMRWCRSVAVTSWPAWTDRLSADRLPLRKKKECIRFSVFLDFFLV